MTDKELEAAASGFLDVAFNLGEPGTAVSEHVGDKFVQRRESQGWLSQISFVLSRAR
jgi:hypothetical protein